LSFLWLQPGATTRKHAIRVDRPQSGSYIDPNVNDDEDGTSRKYSRRGKSSSEVTLVEVTAFHL
jgi:hypothetical protein